MAKGTALTLVNNEPGSVTVNSVEFARLQDRVALLEQTLADCTGFASDRALGRTTYHYLLRACARVGVKPGRPDVPR